MSWIVQAVGLTRLPLISRNPAPSLLQLVAICDGRCTSLVSKSTFGEGAFNAVLCPDENTCVAGGMLRSSCRSLSLSQHRTNHNALLLPLTPHFQRRLSFFCSRLPLSSAADGTLRWFDVSTGRASLTKTHVVGVPIAQLIPL
jgi:hypothetical protein